MSTIERRCVECGFGESLEFTFHGIQPPLTEDLCPRCLQPILNAVHYDAAELGDDCRAVPRPGGGVYQVSERAEAIQRVLIRRLLPYLDEQGPPTWDRRLGLALATGRLWARVFVDERAAQQGIELFTELCSVDSTTPALLVAVHVLSSHLEGDLVIARSDLDLTRWAAHETAARVVYRYFVPLDESDARFDAHLCRAKGEAEAAARVVDETVSGRSDHHDRELDVLDETKVRLPVVQPSTPVTEDSNAAEVSERVRRYLARVDLLASDAPAEGPFTMQHRDLPVRIGVEPGDDGVRVVLEARLLLEVGREALPFLADFNRAEVMGGFLVDDGGDVVFRHTLLGDDLDIGELLKALAHVAGIAADRSPVLLDEAGGKAPTVAEGTISLEPLFAMLDGDGLLEDVAVSWPEALQRVDRYLHTMGLAPSVDATGTRWVPSGSTQVGLRALEGAHGALIVVQAPVLYEVSDSIDLAGVLNELNGQVSYGTFTYDPALRTVWFAQALAANDMDRSELAQALLYVGDTADHWDDELILRLGGQRTLDVVREGLDRHAEQVRRQNLGALLDADRELRLQAARSLAYQEGEEVVDALLASLADPEADVAYAALRALIGGHSQHVEEGLAPRLAELACSPGFPSHTRRYALLGLELLLDPSGLDALEIAMKDDDPGVRAHALRAAGRLGGAGHVREEVWLASTACVDDVDPWVCREALNALARMASHVPDAVDSQLLVGRIVHLILGERPPELRPVAFEALSKMGAPAAHAVAALVGEGAADIQSGVARVLRRAAGEAELPALLALQASCEGEVLEDVVAGLARVGGEEARRAILATYADDSDVDVRRVALEALLADPVARRDPALKAALVAAAKSTEIEPREDAEWGLRMLLEDRPHPGLTPVGREVRRIVGPSLEWLLRDLDDASRARLLHSRNSACEVAAERLAATAGETSYPAYLFGLLRLLKSLGDDEAAVALATMGAGGGAVAACARRLLLED